MHFRSLAIGLWLCLWMSPADSTVDKNYRIYGGTNALFDTWSFVCKIEYQVCGFAGFGTGFFVENVGLSRYYVVTAAHVLLMNACNNDTSIASEVFLDNWLGWSSPYNTTNGYFRTVPYYGALIIHYGSNQLTELHEFHTEFNRVRVPAKKTLLTSEGDFRYDMVLIEIQYSQHPTFIQNGATFLPIDKDEPIPELIIGETCKIAGWGLLNNVSQPRLEASQLQEAELKIIEPSGVCLSAVDMDRISQDGVNGTCFESVAYPLGLVQPGDSGAPVICRRNNKDVLISIISTGAFEDSGIQTTYGQAPSPKTLYEYLFYAGQNM